MTHVPDTLWRVMARKQSGTKIGSISMAKGTSEPGQSNIRIRLLPEMQNPLVPADYYLQLVDSERQPLVLSETRGSHTLEDVCGRVVSGYQMLPVKDDRYFQSVDIGREMQVQRHSAICSKTDQTADAAMRRSTNIMSQRERRRAEGDRRRERLPQEDVLMIIYRAFDSQPELTLQELVDITNQPQGYIKMLIERICYSEKRGGDKTVYRMREDVTNI